MAVETPEQLECSVTKEAFIAPAIPRRLASNVPHPRGDTPIFKNGPPRESVVGIHRPHELVQRVPVAAAVLDMTGDCRDRGFRNIATRTLERAETVGF
jgi:hypothetical protein